MCLLNAKSQAKLASVNDPLAFYLSLPEWSTFVWDLTMT